RIVGSHPPLDLLGSLEGALLIPCAPVGRHTQEDTGRGLLGRADEEHVEIANALLFVRPTHGRSKLALGRRPLLTNELRVCRQRLTTLLDHVPHTLRLHEDDQRELRVPPPGVPEELVDRVDEARRAVPELALADEEVATLVLDEDVSVAA